VDSCVQFEVGVEMRNEKKRPCPRIADDFDHPSVWHGRLVANDQYTIPAELRKRLRKFLTRLLIGEEPARRDGRRIEGRSLRRGMI
jgi:hypothetical protein